VGRARRNVWLFLCFVVNASYLCSVKNLLYLFIVLFIFSCSSENEKVVKLDDIVSGSKEINVEKDTIAFNDTTQKLSFFVNRLCDSLKINKKTTFIDSSFDFPERFHPIKIDKVTFHQGDLISYKHWKWSDSIKATQAFFNWLDQFGDGRKSLIVGDEVNVTKKGFIVLLQDKSIVYLEFASNFKLTYYADKLTKCGFGKHWKYILFQQPFRKTTWIDCISDTTNCQLYPSDLSGVKLKLKNKE
jgi:hypothetical protein